VKGNIIMKRRLIAYAFVFAASVATGYVVTQPASAATRLSVTVTAQPVHYQYRYYAPAPGYYHRYYAPAPRYYYGPRTPTAYWRWRNSGWTNHHRHGFADHRDRGHHDRGHHGNDHHDRKHRGH